MRQFSLAFSDILFNLLLTFVSLFILSYLFINPIADSGKVSPPVEIMITLEWNDESRIDLDLWVMGPVGRSVGFLKQDNGYISLDRDDRGRINDTYVLDGIEREIFQNIETTVVRGIEPGIYYVNVHYFTGGDYDGFEPGKYARSTIKEEAHVTIMEMNPFKTAVERKVKLSRDEETTIASFRVDESGNILEISTNINRSIMNSY